MKPCPHRPPCGGCPRFGERGIDPEARTALAALARACAVPGPSIVSGTAGGFRHRARLAIRGRVNSPKLGLFEPGTHRVVHIPRCEVQHPLINRVASVVRRALVETRIASYSERAQLGLARHLQVVVERESQRAQVVLVANAPGADVFTACFERIRERLGDELHSLWFNANTSTGNTILGPEFERWCGPDAVIEHFGEAAIHYPPGAFGQSNLDIAASIIEHVRARIPPGARVAEFYAGVGAIGLSVLSRVSRIVMNEFSVHSLRGLHCGVAALDAVDRAKVAIAPGTAADACAALLDADLVIADPPRKGLDPPLIEQLNAHPPARFLYISCGLESFLRDALCLLEGAFRLTELTAFNLLPFTQHVETFACFERR
jgi:tRNA/tmRNA/rRNA uracil-C5-methylase (TrmA/RlmC/RlmD family)